MTEAANVMFFSQNACTDNSSVCRFVLRMANESVVYYQTHDNFHIGNESTNYKLSVAPLNHNAHFHADCFYPDMAAMPFSTRDADNDADGNVNCSSMRGGGWWFNGTAGCSVCNPTGRLLLSADGMRSGDDDEVFWAGTAGDFVPVSIGMYVYPL